MMRRVQWYQDQPHMTALYGPHSSLLWPHSKSPYSLLQPLLKENQWPYRNQTSIKMISMTKMNAVVPESAPYNCPIWAPFKPLMAPFKIPLQPLMALFKGDNFPMQHHKIHQSVQLNKQRKMHPL